MRVFAANLIVALGLFVLSAPGLAAAQDGSPRDRIEAAAATLEGVQSMRFQGTTNVTQAATGESTNIFIGTGEFQAPDRGHMTVEQPQLLQVNETITVGPISYMKTVDGTSWVPLSSAVAGPAPSTIAAQLRAVSGYLMSPTLSEEGSQAVISSDVDLARAVTDESPVAAIMGSQYAGDSDSGTQVNGSRVTITIDRNSNLPTNLTTSLSMVAPPTQDGPSGDVTINTSLTLSDFNNPGIVIQSPGE
jgi:hypothetical protein